MKQNEKIMTTSKAIAKIEKVTGEKVMLDKNGQYYTGRISFFSQEDGIICIKADGLFCDNISQALKLISK